MDRIWQWAWNRYGTNYSWAIFAITCLAILPVWLVSSLVVVAIEESDRYVEAIPVAVGVVLILAYVSVLPGVGPSRFVEQWAAGDEVDRAKALKATYTWARGAVVRTISVSTVWVALLYAVVGAIAGAPGSRLVQYGIVGVVFGAITSLVTMHSFVEATMRPARTAIAGDTAIGDSLPRSRPTFAAWSNASMLATAFGFAFAGAMMAAVLDRASEVPVLAVVIAGGLTLGLAVPIVIGASFAPSLRPIRDLAAGTKRVAAGDYSQRLPVVQDDDLGSLAASFNRMQAGLAERQRLQAAFGTYVDPVLAARLLEQGDDVFTGERREVTVVFVDIRDFTPFAEATPPRTPWPGSTLCSRSWCLPWSTPMACEQVPRRWGVGGLRRAE